VTETQPWANRYERDLKDVIRLQSDIVSAIVGELTAQLTPAERARLAAAPAVNPEAYDAYLRGRIETNRLAPKNLEMALEYFRLALRADPGFALAHTGVARVWTTRGHLGYVRPRDAVPEVREAVARALALDDRLAEAYLVLGSSQFYLEWDFEAARRTLDRAAELEEPTNAGLRVTMAAYSAAMGRLEGTALAFEHVLESDPYNPQLRDFYGHQLLRLRRYDDAIAQFQRVLSTEPAFASSLTGLWRAYHFKQMPGEALDYAARYFAAIGQQPAADLVRRDAAGAGYAAALHQAAAALAERGAVPLVVARTYTLAGDKDLALQWLDRAYEHGDSSMVYLKVDPSFDLLRDDARLQALLRRMNFPQ
jgi:tetratricopeptide (TPR) repeat protein